MRDREKASRNRVSIETDEKSKSKSKPKSQKTIQTKAEDVSQEIASENIATETNTEV